ncbi:MAG: hypothetical protein QM820_06965 [Minicystis sp.]
MFAWDMWKKGFDAWENATASYMEQVLKNPLLLGPSGKLMAEAFKAKAQTDKAAAQWLGMMGLPTKRDQERTLHALNQIQSRLADIEEKLAERK